MPNPNRPCYGCEELLTQASYAMRRHATLMTGAIELSRNREPTEEEEQDFREWLIASLNEAQAAWDAYREHLREHGLLPQT